MIISLHTLLRLITGERFRPTTLEMAADWHHWQRTTGLAVQPADIPPHQASALDKHDLKAGRHYSVYFWHICN